MKYLELTLPNAAANLACDEALLDQCENDSVSEVLRFWEPRDYFVVAGYSNHVITEVNMEACKRDGIPILRRCSGGGTVLQGPGCLNYSLVLKIDGQHPVATITAANRYIMEQHRVALSKVLNLQVAIQGITDLAVEGLKFSGNAQRRKRRALIFHGTFLLNFDIDRIVRYLRMPSRQPEYRNNRSHTAFLTNLDVPATRIKSILRETWSAKTPMDFAPDFQPLVDQAYGRDEWNLKF